MITRLFWFAMFLLIAASVQAQGISLPEINGWQAKPEDYLVYQSGLLKAFYVKREYRKGTQQIQILIAGGPEGDRIKQALENRFQLETKDYYLRYQKLGEYQAFLTYHRPGKEGIVAIFLAQDPVLILLARYQGLEDKEALKLLQRLKWEEIRDQGLKLLKRDQR